MQPILPQWPVPSSVRALMTTRNGGVSDGPYAGLNLGAHCGDRPEAVSENRRRLATQLPGEPVWLQQVHGATVIRAEHVARTEPKADAAIAMRPGVVCAVTVADCLPILVATPAAVAAIHAGWRGLAAGVIESTLAGLAGCGEPLVWLGAAIGPKVYEVGAEVHAAFLRRDATLASVFNATRPGHWLLDLYAAARVRLRCAGVPAERIFGGGLCTYSDATRFFSFRRDGATGRMAALIWLE